MLKVFSRLKIQADLRNIKPSDKGWVDIDDFYSAKYANKNNANELKQYLTKTFGPDYEKYFYQDGDDNLTRSFEQKLSKLQKDKSPKHFGNNMVDCRIWTIHLKNGNQIYLLQFDEPKTPPTKMLLGKPEDINSL